MARSVSEIEGLKAAYRRYLGREAEPEAIKAFEGAPVGLNDRITELLGSTEFLNRQRGQLEAELQPDLDAEKQAIERRRQLAEQEYTERERLADLEAGQVRTEAETGNRRLQEALSRTFSRIREDDPYRKLGAVSGAREGFLGEEETRQTKEIGQDLNQKLQFIAERLGVAKRNIGERRAQDTRIAGEDALAVESRFRTATRTGATSRVEQIRQQRRQELEADRTFGLQQGDRLTNLLPELVTLEDTPANRARLRQILESYGYTVTGG